MWGQGRQGGKWRHRIPCLPTVLRAAFQVCRSVGGRGRGGIVPPTSWPFIPYPWCRKQTAGPQACFRVPGSWLGMPAAPPPGPQAVRGFSFPCLSVGSGAGVQLRPRSTHQLPETSGTYGPAHRGNYYRRGSDDTTQVCR